MQHKYAPNNYKLFLNKQNYDIFKYEIALDMLGEYSEIEC